MHNASSSIASYSSSANSNPFTANQWQELEHQALVYKYLISGLPVPPDLLFPLKPFSSPFHVGWTIPGRKMDQEPWRCRRTDGKKWRCSKEAASPDSKYCERHMHRGKSRSRKHVEQQHHLMPGSSSQLKSDYSWIFFLALGNLGMRENRYLYELKSEPSWATRNFSVSSREEQEAFLLTPLTISSSYSTSSRQSNHSSSYLQRQSVGDFPRQDTLQPNHRYFCATKLESGQEPHRTIHRFFDEGPISGMVSWLDPGGSKTSNSLTTRPSMSEPPSSSNDLRILVSRGD